MPRITVSESVPKVRHTDVLIESVKPSMQVYITLTYMILEPDQGDYHNLVRLDEHSKHPCANYSRD